MIKRAYYRRLVLFVVTGLVLIVGAYALYRHFSSTTMVRVSYKHVVTVKLLLSKDGETLQHSAPIVNGTSVRVPKTDNLQLQYTGEEHYESGVKRVDTFRERQVYIDPDYSDEYSRSLALKNTSTFMELLGSAYPNTIGLYRVGEGNLFERGRWYSTTLTYSAPLDPLAIEDNSDTLCVLFENKNNVWSIAATPAIILTKNTNPLVDTDALKTANTYCVQSANT